MNKNKLYFPGLNGVRFLAASMVIISHLEGFKDKAGLPNFLSLPIFKSFGPQGVSVFFVLSGFLITTLLLREKELTKTVELRKFYIRRILRIWPLYYIVLIVAFFILPYCFTPDYFTQITPHFSLKFLLATFLSANVLFLVFGHILLVGPLWSVASEEQFYLVWPHIIKRINKTKLLRFLILLMIIIVGFRTIFLMIDYYHLLPGKDNSKLYKTMWITGKLLKFDMMIVGAIFAYLLYVKSKFLKLVYNHYIQLLSLVLILIGWSINQDFFELKSFILSIFYGILILNISTNTKSILKLENSFFNFGGQISYGMYMYHSLFIALGIKYLNIIQDLLMKNILLYASSFIFTILLAKISFDYFEKPILKYKEKFMVVKSGMKK